jgi:hypothetical protein
MRMAATPIFRKGARGILLLFSFVLPKGAGQGVPSASVSPDDQFLGYSFRMQTP